MTGAARGTGGDVPGLSLHSSASVEVDVFSGAADERGTGDGVGTTVNGPLPAGTGDDGYRDAFEGTVLPSLRRSRWNAGLSAMPKDLFGQGLDFCFGFAVFTFNLLGDGLRDIVDPRKRT